MRRPRPVVGAVVPAPAAEARPSAPCRSLLRRCLGKRPADRAASRLVSGKGEHAGRTRLRSESQSESPSPDASRRNRGAAVRALRHDPAGILTTRGAARAGKSATGSVPPERRGTPVPRPPRQRGAPSSIPARAEGSTGSPVRPAAAGEPRAAPARTAESVRSPRDPTADGESRAGPARTPGSARTDDGLVVKRNRKTEDGWELVSNNPKYPPRPADDDDRIVGRVAWHGSRSEALRGSPED